MSREEKPQKPIRAADKTPKLRGGPARPTPRPTGPEKKKIKGSAGGLGGQGGGVGSVGSTGPYEPPDDSDDQDSQDD